ncbi:MAG: hypothetical protein ABIA04_06105 [Pseudomonadota bacterium]
MHKREFVVECQGLTLRPQAQLLEQINRSISNANSQIDKLISSNIERTSKQITELDKSLGEELEKSLQTLGSQLTSLSNKFVQDYSPLTDKLQRVLEIAKNVE